MYKETVKFFIRTATKEAYPVLKGGKEDTAREWSSSHGVYNHILKRTINSQGIEIEVKNIFHKVQVIDTESRGQGGKLFKCKLFYTVEGSEESYVILDLRTESLFSIIQKGEFLNEGMFKGTYAISNTGGTYYIYNLELEDSYFYNDYQEYLSKVARESDGVILKNTLGLTELIEGHVYTKISKGMIERRRYLYLGNIPVKKTALSQAKSMPVYFDLNSFYNYFYHNIYFQASSNNYMTAIARFFYNVETKGFLLESSLSELSNSNIYVKTTNKFFEDISDTEPVDMAQLVSDKLISHNSDKISCLNIPNTQAKHFMERYSGDFVKTLRNTDNHLFDVNAILYPIEHFKTVANKDKYIKSLLTVIEKTNTTIKNYLANYATNEENRLKIVSEIIKETNDYTSQYINSSNSLKNINDYTITYGRVTKLLDINDYTITYDRLTKLLDNNNILIGKLNLYKD